MVASRSPLDGTARLIVDGTNLLHALGRGGAAPPAAAIGRLRAAIPGAIGIDLVFDGIGPGVSGRLASAMRVRYAGRRSADDMIVELAAAAAVESGGGPAATARVLVVSDDRELRGRLVAGGARVVGVRWLLGRLDRSLLAAPAPGNRRPALGSAPAVPQAGATDDADERPGWRAGRGATRKKGPARRVPRHRRHPRRAG